MLLQHADGVEAQLMQELPRMRGAQPNVARCDAAAQRRRAAPARRRGLRLGARSLPTLARPPAAAVRNSEMRRHEHRRGDAEPDHAIDQQQAADSAGSCVLRSVADQ